MSVASASVLGGAVHDRRDNESVTDMRTKGRDDGGSEVSVVHMEVDEWHGFSSSAVEGIDTPVEHVRDGFDSDEEESSETDEDFDLNVSGDDADEEDGHSNATMGSGASRTGSDAGGAFTDVADDMSISSASVDEGDEEDGEVDGSDVGQKGESDDSSGSSSEDSEGGTGDSDESEPTGEGMFYAVEPHSCFPFLTDHYSQNLVPFQDHTRHRDCAE